MAMGISAAASKRLVIAISSSSSDGRFSYQTLVAALREEGLRMSNTDDFLRYLAAEGNVWMLAQIGQACASEARQTNEILRGLNRALTDLSYHFEEPEAT